jgi:competence protein ComEA
MSDIDRSFPTQTATTSISSTRIKPNPLTGSLPPSKHFPWHSPEQSALALLLALAILLLCIHGLGFARWGCRPVELQESFAFDLNTAPRAALMQVPGIGPKTADRIEASRQQQPHQSVNALIRVPGIKKATLEKARSWLTVQTEVGEGVPPVAMATTKPAKKTVPSKKEAAWTGPPLDVNEAAYQDLLRIPGVGPKSAQRIVDERRRGPFASVDELRRVAGIGPKTLDRIRPYVTVVKTSEVRMASSKKTVEP